MSIIVTFAVKALWPGGGAAVLPKVQKCLHPRAAKHPQNK
jgi:hypothetical protein